MASLIPQAPATPSSSSFFTTSSIRRRFSCLPPSRAAAGGNPNAPEGGEGEANVMRRQRLQLSARCPPKGAAVYVAAPLDTVDHRGGGAGGLVSRNRKLLGASFLALSTCGVYGITVELWWGIVESRAPGSYDWDGYLDLLAIAERCRLKVRVVVAFHHRGSGPGDPSWLPLPQWVLEEMRKDPDLAYTDRFGRRNMEYISLGCDSLSVLNGRTPIQAYSDFLRSFRDTFREYLGGTITEIQIGMGPSGELRYPSCSSEKHMGPSGAPELGEFQCYDKFMIASLNARMQEAGVGDWGNGGPLEPGSFTQSMENSSFFKSDGSWNTQYGHFFLDWYSEMLLHHGERLCMTADTIFRGTGVKLVGKVAAMHWHYRTGSHPSELTAGYYNTKDRDGYIPIAQMFARYGMTLCCSGFDLSDSLENPSSDSSPEGFLRQLMHAVSVCKVQLSGENSRMRTDEASLSQITRNVNIHTDGFGGSFLSFNFVRMNKSLFEVQNWQRFSRFVRQMSEIRTIQAKLDGGMESYSLSTTVAEGASQARSYL